MSEPNVNEADSNIVYVEHPVSKEEKAKYIGQGKRIIDAKFAPKGAKVIKKPKPKADAEKE